MEDAKSQILSIPTAASSISAKTRAHKFIVIRFSAQKQRKKNHQYGKYMPTAQGVSKLPSSNTSTAVTISGTGGGSTDGKRYTVISARAQECLQGPTLVATIPDKTKNVRYGGTGYHRPPDVGIHTLSKYDGVFGTPINQTAPPHFSEDLDLRDTQSGNPQATTWENAARFQRSNFFLFSIISCTLTSRSFYILYAKLRHPTPISSSLRPLPRTTVAK